MGRAGLETDCTDAPEEDTVIFVDEDEDDDEDEDEDEEEPRPLEE